MRLCPWADVVYGHDGAWWESVHGLPKFEGLKLCQETSICVQYHDIHKIEVLSFDKLLTEDPGVVGFGGNSGFGAINIAIQFGVRRLLLIGFDMHNADGLHWYGRNAARGMNNPTERNFIRWRRVLTDSSGDLASRGIEVVNASPSSAVMCFPKMGVEATLTRWGL